MKYRVRPAVAFNHAGDQMPVILHLIADFDGFTLVGVSSFGEVMRERTKIASMLRDMRRQIRAARKDRPFLHDATGTMNA